MGAVTRKGSLVIDLDQNPARELLTIFQKWKEAGERKDGQVTASAARDISSTSGIDLQIRACELIAAVRDEIDRYEADGHDMASYRRNCPVWAKYVIAYPSGWKTNLNPKSEFPIDKMDLLRALANYLDKIPFNSTVPVDEITQRLDEVEELLDSDETLDPAFCSYFRDLIARARAAVENFKRYGADAVYSAINSVIVATKAAEGFSTDPSAKAKWADVFRNYGTSIAASTTMLFASPVVTQLTSGLG